MWRLLLLLIAVAVATSVVAWLVTGKAAYKRWAIRLGKLGLAGVLVIFALLILERLAG